MTCSEKCILSNDSAIPYQDFTVVQELVTSGIRINIDSWYGSGGGLGSVDIFRSDVSLQPEISNSQSTGASDSCSTAPSSTATTTGNWTEVYSYQTYQNFLIASFPASELHSSDVSVTYQPYVLTPTFLNDLNNSSIFIVTFRVKVFTMSILPHLVVLVQALVNSVHKSYWISP